MAKTHFLFSVFTVRLMQVYLTTVGKGKVHGTYYLARQDPGTGNQYISLVGQEDINGTTCQRPFTAFALPMLFDRLFNIQNN